MSGFFNRGVTNIEEDIIFQDVRRFSYPVIFDNGYEDFPYSVKGTAFLVSYNNYNYLVTASHVIKDIAPEKILVPYNTFESREFIPFERVIKINDDEKVEDNDFKDIIILKISTRADFKQKVNLLPKLNLGKKYAYELLPYVHKLFSIGYPSHNNWINYCEYKIKLQQSLFTGEYVSKAELQHCHCAKYEDEAHLDGMSGSPVYALTYKGNTINYGFLGIMIRSRVFLDGYVLINALNKLGADLK